MRHVGRRSPERNPLDHRRRSEPELAATAAATLLIVDAWFDITTRSTGRSLAEAVLLAVFFELPAAALSLMIVSRANAHLAMSRRSTEGDGCCAA